MGFTKPLLSRGALGVSYTSVSPLPAPRGAAGGLLSVALSVGFAPEALGFGLLAALPLAGILPAGARTFLTHHVHEGAVTPPPKHAILA
jgi:hypothetical protein